MTEPITIVLADDDAVFRGLYRRLFTGTEGFGVIGEAGGGQHACRLIGDLRPDVALVDVQMPGGSGLDVVRETKHLPTRIIMLTTFDLDEYVTEALREGAAGFLLKNASSAEVLAAVRAVHAGHSSLAPEITARLVQQLSGQWRPRPHAFSGVRLSERELQVIRLVAQGTTNQQIADGLFLSLATVRTYLRRLFVKLAVNDRTQLAVLAHQAGLLHEER
ncbi:response regulator transcription factor [Leucobacter sp. M11]|uniref:response regulator transcription factor n=1 Tax=Leucobacter sp. M11 TaxID=2993565 RepID=UPI002D7F0410|nr:response regulator transcription factor [Leucobacter sp. M11]MEB4613139.1 response regulator transcription factor [Leucobacter sp. M11]